MKFVKKLTCLFLAVVMTMAMGITAFADEAATVTDHTIKSESTTHKYEIYQIMVGDFDANGNITSAAWGTNAASSYKAGDAVDGTVLKTISAISGTDSQKAAALKAYVDLTSTPVKTIEGAGSVSVPAGYYLIKDVDKSVSGADAYTLYLFKALKEDLTITPKTSVPELIKKVKDTNDSVAGSTTGWQDSADYDIGDTIPYQLTATLKDISMYDHYYMEFSDTMTHLTYVNDSAVVKIDGQTITDGYTVSWNAETKLLTVVITDAKAKGANSNSVVTVDYNATLDNDAVIGSTGNPNEAYLIFSNNPNNTGNGTSKPDDTGETPKDKNIVFTYKVTANKVDANKKPLAGAKFTLYKWEVVTPATDGQAAVYGWVSKGLVEATGDATNGYTAAWSGLDDGKYKLEETNAPEGYVKAEDIEFTIEATHDTDSADPQLKTLTGGDKFTGEVSTGTLSTTVINTTTSSLPSTGGMGTTVIYIAGIAMIVAAGVVVIARKRMA